MFEETYHCDGPNCDNKTPKSSPGSSWRVTMWLRGHVTAVRSGSEDLRENHYCSRKCEHEHTYLQMSGDNGK